MRIKTDFPLCWIYKSSQDNPQTMKNQLQKPSAYLFPTFSIVLVQQNLNTSTIVRMNISEVFHLNRKTQQKRQQDFFPPLQTYSLTHFLLCGLQAVPIIQKTRMKTLSQKFNSDQPERSYEYLQTLILLSHTELFSDLNKVPLGRIKLQLQPHPHCLFLV